MKKEQPNYLEKISAVIGDCNLPNLGIGDQYIEILKNEVCYNSYNNLLKLTVILKIFLFFFRWT